LTSEIIFKGKATPHHLGNRYQCFSLSPGVLCDADKKKLEKGDAISHEKSIFSISEDQKRRF
jgi:hypothetical protein